MGHPGALILDCGQTDRRKVHTSVTRGPVPAFSSSRWHPTRRQWPGWHRSGGHGSADRRGAQRSWVSQVLEFVSGAEESCRWTCPSECRRVRKQRGRLPALHRVRRRRKHRRDLHHRSCDRLGVTRLYEGGRHDEPDDEVADGRRDISVVIEPDAAARAGGRRVPGDKALTRYDGATPRWRSPARSVGAEQVDQRRWRCAGRSRSSSCSSVRGSARSAPASVVQPRRPLLGVPARE